MLEFVMFITKPNGEVPIISDADGARVWRFNNVSINDHRSYLALGSVLFNRGDFKYVSGNNFEELIWLLGPKGFDKYQRLSPKEPNISSKAFDDGGYYTFRENWTHKSLFLIFDCGYITMGNNEGKWSGHGHSDLLSFVLDIFGYPFIVDIGSYTYTGDKKWHDYFRGTRGHNTVIIDSNDQCGLDKRWTFKRHAKPVYRKFYFSKDLNYVCGAHDGYSIFTEPVVHKREIIWEKIKKRIIIVDTFDGQGKHQISLLLHFHPDVKSSVRDGNVVCYLHETSIVICPIWKRDVKVNISRGLENSNIKGWYSENYGVKVPADEVEIESKINCPDSLITVIRFFEGHITNFTELDSMNSDEITNLLLKIREKVEE
jgi:hypothetical protein